MVANQTAPTSAPSHGLTCPSCRIDLVMSDRQGIEIDYCPKCRGVWLDRGELDKIIERNLGQPEAAPRQQQSYPQQSYEDPRYGHGNHHKGYRRKSWLSEIFD